MKKITPSAKLKDFDRQWYLVDAKEIVLGQLATRVADTLRGKNKANFSTNVDCGDNVVVINADKVVLTGNKWNSKMYYRHSGHLGHLKTQSAGDVREKQPKRIIKEAVYGMLPKNKLRKHFMAKLHIYAGDEHRHAGQNPTPLSIR